MSLDLFSAFIIGLLGSAHCVGMCGGISTMLTTAMGNNAGKLLLTLSYNFGRIATYALIGAIVGYSGSIAAKNVGVPLAGLRLFSGVFLVLLGLYLGQWYMGVSKIEKLGKFIWRFLSPLSKKFIPVNSMSNAFLLGGIWGWLPCGLVYSTLTWALASGTAIDGALIMVCFGMGTLPALVSMSLGILKIKNLMANITFRKIAAFFVILYGIYTIIFASRQLF